MKSIAVLLAFLFILAPAGPAASRDWTRAIAATPAGGYAIGNPAAPVKVIEFFSLTCPHCRHFTEIGLPALKSGYIATGKVSLEIRNFVLNPYDLAASVLQRCGTPATAVRLFDAVYADQEKLFGGARDLPPEVVERISSAPTEKRTGVLAREAGIDRWFVAHGLPSRRVDQCLADPKAEQRLVDIREAGVKDHKVRGTPSFIVNGTTVDGVTWDELEPAIKAALDGKKG